MCALLVNYYTQPYNSSSKFLILILKVDFSHFAASAPPCVQPLNPPKHKILIEIPPYYIDTLLLRPELDMEASSREDTSSLCLLTGQEYLRDLARHFKTDPTETVALCFGISKTPCLRSN
jgi:hypothetical protein